MSAGQPNTLQEAVTAAERLVEEAGRDRRSPWLELEQIAERLPLAVDRAMGESGLWAPELAARAIRQAQGDPLEAAQLIRAHRSTLPRLGRGLPVSTDELRVTRRISSAFRNPPGGQVLGRTLDYVGRLLDLLPEDEGRSRVSGSTAAGGANGHDHSGHQHLHEQPRQQARQGSEEHTHGLGTPVSAPAASVERTPANLLSVLRGMDVVRPVGAAADPAPYDVTRTPARSDAPRSAWLQTMARADTGSLMHMWYGNSLRSGGHEIPGEVRHGTLSLSVPHPYTGQPVAVTRVRVSEVQTFHSVARAGELARTLDVGYGLCLGHNDRKAISMAGLDLLLVHHEPDSAIHREVLFTLDGMDSTGYARHLKLPHHAEFRSLVERARAVTAVRNGAIEDGDKE
ncbi:hypothetical protein QR77_00200 [Streptomyces sp. 150FB]|uniref:carbon-phosphorus lyase complex subunit PhnI n=1 Tax=Streptomyces sp. 150FB TaxID=1576605 RepID=UPI00058915D7|nr:carbon-phosphorus lyase complex subunit PhnI [Streptomyces sp. 150FB]KIF72853.1 hypothetical protein QR77_00200 [Streptomyces sp. 150FB]